MSNRVTAFWSGLSRGARLAAVGAATVALALLLWGLFSVFHQDYRVLFADLSEADAAAITARLREDKVAYRLSGAGSTILVPAEQVHDVRLALMAADVPLSGGVGFELFDKQGLGSTEHSQKVSYQRALQGELARTIGTLENVKQVRVHLVLPESTLFTRDRQEASAAVALTMKPQTSLERQQIVGVQRLVAAAVPGLAAERVVITDQRGVTLSAADPAGIGAGALDARLQVKREVEDYITAKIVRLLGSAYGPGQAIVSVDATLNFNATKTTIQDLLPGGGQNGPEGRVVRRRQVTGASSNEPIWTSAVDGAAPARTPSSSMEVEYEYGRRIDEVIAAPGAITHLSVGIIVPDKVTDEQRRKVTELVTMAAGIDVSRGDAVSIQPLSQLDDRLEPEAAVDAVPQRIPSSAPSQKSAAGSDPPWIVGGLIAAVILIAALAIIQTMRRRPLSAEQRQRMLEDIQRALTDENVAGSRARS